MNNKLQIILLVGGASPERAVSKDTSRSIYETLIKLGHEVHLIDPAYGKNQPKEKEKYFSKEEFSNVTEQNYLSAFNLSVFDDVDLVFIGLHGNYGEDGTVQSILEMKGIKYTGSDSVSSVIAMDKVLSKIIFDKEKIPTPDWFSLKANNFDLQQIKEKLSSGIGYPIVVKPNDQGSTVGLTICRSESELKNAIENAFKFSDLILLEKYIEGRELTVAILNNEALPVLEIKPKSGFYDYESKYTAGKSEYIVPAEIPDDVSERMKQDALKSFKTLRCSVYGRVDFRLDENNNYFVLEVNTLPGMTSLSLVPKMANAVGISFDELIEKIIELSL